MLLLDLNQGGCGVEWDSDVCNITVRAAAMPRGSQLLLSPYFRAARAAVSPSSDALLGFGLLVAGCFCSVSLGGQK